MKNATQSMIIRCKCATARVTVEVSAGGSLIGNDQNAWVQAAQSGSYAVERLPGGWNRNDAFGCLGCGRAFKVTTIRGRRTGHTCDARCMASKGPSCECSCGGKNHGGAYA